MELLVLRAIRHQLLHRKEILAVMVLIMAIMLTAVEAAAEQVLLVLVLFITQLEAQVALELHLL
jgi:hypothetical protein